MQENINTTSTSRLSRWDAKRNIYKCADHTVITVPNRAFGQPGQDKSRHTHADGQIVFMNGVVYRCNEKIGQSRIWLFVSKTEFDRNTSTIVRGAKTIRTFSFPSAVKSVQNSVFAKN